MASLLLEKTYINMKRSDLAARISVLRNAKGFTQKELAELCNVDIRTIQRIESGEVVPRKHTLKLLANILETELSNFNTSTEGDPGEYNKEIKRAFVAGLIFFINAILVVFDLITGSLLESAVKCYPFCRLVY